MRVDHEVLLKLLHYDPNTGVFTWLSSNRGLSKQNKSGYKGVRKEKNGKFMARITVDGKSIHLGTFATADKAAEAYDSAALTHFGEFALTNKTLRSNHGYEH